MVVAYCLPSSASPWIRDRIEEIVAGFVAAVPNRKCTQDLGSRQINKRIIIDMSVVKVFTIPAGSTADHPIATVVHRHGRIFVEHVAVDSQFCRMVGLVIPHDPAC